MSELKLKPEEQAKKPADKSKALSSDKGSSTLTDAGEWAKIRAAWARTRVEKMQAHADRFFTTDEDLPLAQHFLLISIALFFVIFFLWANFASLDEVTRGDGRVVPSSEIQVLQSLEGGIVDQFLVKEGDSVEAGQAVMRLQDVQATSDLGANRQQYLALQAKSKRLHAEAEGLATPEFSQALIEGVPQSVQEEMQVFQANQRNQQSQLQVLQQQLAQRQQEVTELTGRIRDLRGVINLAREERDMIMPLVERGSAPKMELMQLERGIAEQETELNSLLSSLPRVKSAVEENEARMGEIKSAARAQAQTELAATIAEMNSIGQTLTALADRKTRTEIRSPVNGTIKDIKVSTVGGVVKPGADLIEIVPRDDQLIVEARIRPADIAFLHPGQKTVVKLTAYDYSIYGGLTGELVDISADTITNEKGETFYRVRIRTPQTFLKRKGEVLDIIPGMVASVDILTGKKTVMEYLLKPFIKTLDLALKER